MVKYPALNHSAISLDANGPGNENYKSNVLYIILKVIWIFSSQTLKNQSTDVLTGVDFNNYHLFKINNM